jgi:hypothetical protein
MINERMYMAQGWNDTSREKHKYSAKTLSQCHFIQHKSDEDWPGIEIGPPGEIINGVALLSNYYLHIIDAEYQLAANRRTFIFLIFVILVLPTSHLR